MDVQACLRLMAITLTAEIILRDEAGWGGHAGNLLECHRTIPERPALAEALLADLRAEVLGDGGRMQARRAASG
jgi:hypothetical protein